MLEKILLGAWLGRRQRGWRFYACRRRSQGRDHVGGGFVGETIGNGSKRDSAPLMCFPLLRRLWQSLQHFQESGDDHGWKWGDFEVGGHLIGNNGKEEKGEFLITNVIIA